MVKTALIIGNKSVTIQLEGFEGDLLGCPCWPANIRHTVGPRDLQSWRGRFPRVPWGGRAYGYVRWSHSTMQTTQTTTSTMNPVPSITAAIASASYDLRVYTAPAYTGSSSPAARFTKYLTIYRKIIVSLSSDRLTIVTSKVLKFLLE